MIEDRRTQVRVTVWSRIKTVGRVVFWNADTLTVRLIMANASIVWCISLLVDPHTFNRPVYALMRTYGDEHQWAAVFLLHGLGVYWRLFDVKSRPTWALLINSLGLGVWLLSTVALNLAVNNINASTSLEWILCLASAWALYRTGLKGEIVTP